MNVPYPVPVAAQYLQCELATKTVPVVAAGGVECTKNNQVDSSAA